MISERLSKEKQQKLTPKEKKESKEKSNEKLSPREEKKKKLKVNVPFEFVIEKSKKGKIFSLSHLCGPRKWVDGAHEIFWIKSRAWPPKSGRTTISGEVNSSKVGKVQTAERRKEIR